MTLTGDCRAATALCGGGAKFGGSWATPLRFTGFRLVMDNKVAAARTTRTKKTTRNFFIKQRGLFFTCPVEAERFS